MKQFYQTSCAMLVASTLSISAAFAQQTVTGRVTDANGPLSGVTVTIPGTAKATQTDNAGNFTIQTNKGEKLRFTTVGYAVQEITVTDAKTISVLLKGNDSTIDEVVVTAMGVKRDKKSLGYSFQEIKGSTLTDARENNLANALSGKVSSLQVIKGSNGPSSSSKIVLRGFNSLVADNQPLIVVDGVPMDNFTGSNNNDYWNPAPDMGSGLGDLNPEDIESMSVLKGGAASALYGSRASNGVILITTKSGKSKDGVGISYSTTTGIENIFMTPKLQNDFSQGEGGKYGSLSGSSWGEKIAGQEVDTWNGKTNLKSFNNIGNFFDTGFNTTQNINFQQAISDKVNVYSSATYLHDKSKTPGMKLNRLNLINRVNAKFGSRNQWSTDIKVQYMKNMAYNRSSGGQNPGNYYAQTLLFPRSLDLTQFKPGMDQLGVEQIWYTQKGSDNYGLNPYWAINNKLSNDTRDRYLMNATVKYDFNDWLSADVRFGTDNYSTKIESKTYTGYAKLDNTYSSGTNKFYENNYIASITARKDNLFGKWGGSASLYGQIMENNRYSLDGSVKLRVPNLFTMTNAVGMPKINESISKKQINSIYGNIEINYDTFWFLTMTGRNDWTSSLHKDHNSYFYPSISTSLVLSEMINKSGGTMPSWFSFAKVRASYAQTGRDMNPYQLYNTYKIETDANGNTGASKRDVLYNKDVVNELQKSIEFGFETRFIDNRIGLDFAFYKNNSTNQLIDIPMNPLSSYSSFKANAGDILNQGIELLVNVDILRNTPLKWNITANASKNKNKIIELHKEVKQIPLGGYDNVFIRAAEGELYGAIYGTTFLRVEDRNSEFYNQLILNTQTGLPQGNNALTLLGDQTARALVGVTNSFAYKSFGLSFQVDGRFGGKFFSGTQQALQASGSAAETVVNGQRENFVVNGVVLKDGQYVANTAAVSPQNYWSAVATSTGNLGITEQNLYNATNIRIRNVALNYAIPSKHLKSSMVKSAKFGIAVNNLAMLKSYGKGVDPESVFAAGSNAVGFENLAFPTSRSFFLNIAVGF